MIIQVDINVDSKSMTSNRRHFTIFLHKIVSQPFDARLGGIKYVQIFLLFFRWLTQPAIVNAFYSPNHNSISKFYLGPNEYFTSNYKINNYLI